MNPLEKLTQYFTHFPGIGPRQARRFVYYLLTRDRETLEELSRAISEVKSKVVSCSKCFRFFPVGYRESATCPICSSERNTEILMITPRDSDLEQIERAKVYDGLYFVLGGTVPILEKNPEARIRIKELKKRLEQDFEIIKEVILTANLNPEGEHTMEYIESEIKNILSPDVKITHLGRGFSTGSEIEYADSETIKYALKSRF